MSEKQMRQLIMLGLGAAAIYYIFFRAKPFVPGTITITPENAGLLPSPQPVNLAPGWLTAP
jgi:hypothetical protein